MYNIPRYPGDLQDRPRIFGFLENNSKVRIKPKDLGLTITQYVLLYKDLLEFQDQTDIQQTAELFRERTGLRLVSIQLEDHPMKFTGSSFVPADPKIFISFQIQNKARDE